MIDNVYFIFGITTNKILIFTCVKQGDEWLTSWSWSCNFRQSIQNLKDSEIGPFFPLEMSSPYPQAQEMGETDMFMDYAKAQCLI